MDYEHNRAMRYIHTFLLLLSLFQSCAAHSLARRLGDFGRYSLPIVASLVSISHQDREGLGQFGLGFSASLGATELLKRTVHETRPNGASPHSFPSGHTAWAFSAATYLSVRYGPQFGVPATIAATLVGVSRVISRRHYAHDVLTGALLASSLTYLFTKPLKNANARVGLVASDPSRFAGSLLDLEIRW